MGINPTPFSYKSFTFDGKSTREFGVYITGEGVFNAPERAVEMISIPGRDGEYALDQGHFNNIEVTYRAGIVADSTTDFAEAISNFRNWLASREGYCRLTDEYNTEEYRMAVFKNAIALEHEGLLTGEFDVTFDCKPQRYLAIGEELVEIGAWGNTETAEGEIVTIDASSDTAVKALTADIEPIQDLHGYDAPWVGGAGKNLLDLTNATLTRLTLVNASQGKVKADISSYYYGAITLSGANVPSQITQATLNGTPITLQADNNNGKRISILIYGTRTNGTSYQEATEVASNSVTITPTLFTSVTSIEFRILRESSSYTDTTTEVSGLRLSVGSGIDFEPYENICPISGWDEVGVSVNGVNQWDEEWLNGYLSNSGNFISDASSVCAKNYIPIKQSATYYAVCPSGKSLRICAYKADKTFISLQSIANQTFMLPSGTAYIKWSCYGYGATYANDISINYPSTDHDYHAYNGTTYTTTLPSTTYGGTLDLVSGTFKPAPYYASYNGEALEGEWVSDRDKYVAGTTPTTGAQVVNIGKEGTATQLTGQQVALLLGENNIFADSGNVTVEYGHNPTLLTNPTWFPSKPLLEVEGYGDINLGKHKIEVENVPIGDVSLAPGTSFYLENRTQTFSLDADKYNEGDIITVAVDQIGFDYSISTNTSAHAHSTTATDSMSGVTSTVKADTNFWGTSCLFYGTTKPSSITFTAGTSANFVNEVSGRLTIQLETLALRNILYTLTETVSYDATQNTISFSLSSTTSYDAAEVRSAELRNRFTPSKIDGINVFSTISAVDGTVYIDCEVGECWNVNGDVILPLNNVISLGSDLPTLPPGDTEVTYDNTITKVEVQPNWWKV